MTNHASLYHTTTAEKFIPRFEVEDFAHADRLENQHYESSGFTGWKSWSDSTAWSAVGSSTPAGVPIDNSVVVIHDKVIYNMNGTTGREYAKPYTIVIKDGAKLRFQSNDDIDLYVTNILIEPGGELRLGTSTNPIEPVTAGDQAEIIFRGIDYEDTDSPADGMSFTGDTDGTIFSPADPFQFGNGIVVLSTYDDNSTEYDPLDEMKDDPDLADDDTAVSAILTVHGAVLSKTFVRLDDEALEMDTSVTLADAVTDWAENDELLFPDTRQFPSQRFGHNGNLQGWIDNEQDFNGVFLMDGQWEVRSADAISMDGLTVTLDSNLDHDHLGPRDGSHDSTTGCDVNTGALDADHLPHVANLTRTMVFRSEFPNIGEKRGHIIAMGPSEVDVRYARFTGMGRTRAAKLFNAYEDSMGDVVAGMNQSGRYPIHLHHCNGPLRRSVNYNWEWWPGTSWSDGDNIPEYQGDYYHAQYGNTGNTQDHPVYNGGSQWADAPGTAPDPDHMTSPVDYSFVLKGNVIDGGKLDSSIFDCGSGTTHVGFETDESGYEIWGDMNFPWSEYVPSGQSGELTVLEYDMSDNVIGYEVPLECSDDDRRRIPFKWGMVVHNSHFGLVEDNVVYNVGGAGFVTEDGNESYNRFNNNLAVRIPRGLLDDGSGFWCSADDGIADAGGPEFSADTPNRGLEGAGFWFRGPNNVVTNNYASGASHVGLTIHSRRLFQERMLIPAFPGGRNLPHPASTYDEHVTEVMFPNEALSRIFADMPIREWAGNEAYGAMVNSMMFYNIGQGSFIQYPIADNVLSDSYLWHASDSHVRQIRCDQMHYDGLTIRGDKSLLSKSYFGQSHLASTNGFQDEQIYVTRTTTLTDIDIQGCVYGLHKLPTNTTPGDITASDADPPTEARLQNDHDEAAYVDEIVENILIEYPGLEAMDGSVDYADVPPGRVVINTTGENRNTLRNWQNIRITPSNGVNKLSKRDIEISETDCYYYDPNDCAAMYSHWNVDWRHINMDYSESAHASRQSSNIRFPHNVFVEGCKFQSAPTYGMSGSGSHTAGSLSAALSFVVDYHEQTQFFVPPVSGIYTAIGGSGSDYSTAFFAGMPFQGLTNDDLETDYGISVMNRIHTGSNETRTRIANGVHGLVPDQITLEDGSTVTSTNAGSTIEPAEFMFFTEQQSYDGHAVFLTYDEANETFDAEFRFYTNKPMNVEVQEDTGDFTTVSDTSLDRVHRLVVEDLDPDTTYNYRLYAYDFTTYLHFSYWPRLRLDNENQYATFTTPDIDADNNMVVDDDSSVTPINITSVRPFHYQIGPDTFVISWQAIKEPAGFRVYLQELSSKPTSPPSEPSDYTDLMVVSPGRQKDLSKIPSIDYTSPGEESNTSLAADGDNWDGTDEINPWLSTKHHIYLSGLDHTKYYAYWVEAVTATGQRYHTNAYPDEATSEDDLITWNVLKASNPACFADLDGSGQIDFDDLLALLMNYGCDTGCTQAQGDIAGDNPALIGDAYDDDDVDINDLYALLDNLWVDCP